MPLVVHSLNLTSATYFGAAQCARSFVFGVVVKGDVFCSIALSFFPISFKSASVNPPPECPA